MAQGPISLLVDSHAHLDLAEDPPAAIAEAAANGVSHILTVGFDLVTSEKAVNLARRFPGVRASVGIHPHDASQADDAALARLRELASDPEVAAIGETGLDYYRDRSPRDIQKAVFKKHMDLARETGLTLMVHTREAPDDTLGMLKKHATGLRVILHCFSLYEQVEECIEHGFYMSVAGNVTFPGASRLRDAAARIPDHLLLTETDAPWLTPVPHRGKPNRPANIRYVLDALASLRGQPADDLARHVLANYLRAFPSR